jgi:hypothetical protein
MSLRRSLATVTPTMAAESDRPKSDAIKLDSIQREALLGEIKNILARPLPPDARAPYEHLQQCIDDSLEIPAELNPYLGMMIESSIISGNAKRYGAGIQQSMVALFQRLPNGKAIAESISAINTALGKLNGHVIEQVSTTLRAPGSYALTIKTDQLQIVIILERTGLSVESLEVNLG